ncbi:MAG: DUF4450 domain-containing protein [Chitinophagaceae bacterium]|nr:DUF4450 domain-containing protein [Chitinophagaceae bacterium]
MKLLACLSALLFAIAASSQPSPQSKPWHGKERVMHYAPDGEDFVLVNGKRRFTRALYGTNTGFRVEAGDLPEFALYMPGMGGNFRFALSAGNKAKWITDADVIKTRYRPGAMLYEVKDALLGGGTMYITVLASSEGEGMIIQTSFKAVSKPVELLWVFGGASGKKFSRDGDIGADPESSFYLHADNCKDNAYSIGKNFFHLSYGSGKVLTEEERYEIQHQPMADRPTIENKNIKQLAGLFPTNSVTSVSDANQWQTPGGTKSMIPGPTPVVTGRMGISNITSYFIIQNAAGGYVKDYRLLQEIFTKAEAVRKKLAGRVKVNTPDKYINTIGGSLSVAADAIWEDPSYLHGAIAWRMRLNAWRGAYVADPFGWHDRARKHFSSYALSQVITPAITGVVMDTALHLARHQEKIGTALFSDGYICRNPNGDIRAHHYDMNLVFVDQLLNHFNWTGDTGYVREMWPLLKRHLAWEKRNFDSDGDGLYDAYAAIWASDALQYSGGGVTHSSAYNYRANDVAAELARLIGQDGNLYKKEAEKIKKAIERHLWLPKQGSYAEFKDLLGKQLVHPSPGLWTIYHAIDSKVPDRFQAYQNLRYIDSKIPHIPVSARGLTEKDLYLLSTTNWQPYTWSINNVALGENLHTALAYWQGSRSEEAYRLWRSTIIESMYLSASPGGFEQLSFYDAVRGELYRDFADGIGMAGRSLVEGMFGIQPDALHDTLTIQPGYPSKWAYASLRIPDVQFDFTRKQNKDSYVIKSFFKKTMSLKFLLTALSDNVRRVLVNGKESRWAIDNSSVGKPMLRIDAPAAEQYTITVEWSGNSVSSTAPEKEATNGQWFNVELPGMTIVKIFDPQENLDSAIIRDNRLSAKARDNLGKKTIFLLVKQGVFDWWLPYNLDIRPYMRPIQMDSVYVSTTERMEKVDLSSHFNDKVTNIFKHEYLSPRPFGPTLQLPTQGIGNWCYPLTTANIDDEGLRKLAGGANEIRNSGGIVFSSPSNTQSNNVLFTSQWDNFPDSITIPISGNAHALHLLMAGSTNPMQSRITNGMVVVKYSDGTGDTLLLENPNNWWPIEQDYADDGYAFTTSFEGMPERLYLKEGKFARGLHSYQSIKGYSNRAIDGGAATVLDMWLDHKKALHSLTLHAIANDVVIGLMAVTLMR